MSGKITMNVPEIVRLSPITMDSFNQHQSQKVIMELQMELMALRDLIKQIDPKHLYVFSPEYSAFLKSKLPDNMEGEQLDRHKNDSVMDVIDLTFKPNFSK
jgi:hypothetical protein